MMYGTVRLVKVLGGDKTGRSIENIRLSEKEENEQ